MLEEPGVLVVGSEVPNLLQPGVASTLVVSQDVDLAVPVDRLQEVKRKLREVQQLVPSKDEPSVLVPTSDAFIEANFLGLDSAIREFDETYVLEDPEMPLMVFGPLGHLRAGRIVEVEGTRVPLPRPAGLMIEKLLTDRTGDKGARDLLVVAGLLAVSSPADVQELVADSRALPAESRHALRSNLTVLSLMQAQPGMPDPKPLRSAIADLLRELEALGDP